MSENQKNDLVSSNSETSVKKNTDRTYDSTNDLRGDDKFARDLEPEAIREADRKEKLKHGKFQDSKLN